MCVVAGQAFSPYCGMQYLSEWFPVVFAHVDNLIDTVVTDKMGPWDKVSGVFKLKQTPGEEALWDLAAWIEC